MGTRHYLMSHLSIAALLIASVLVFGGCAQRGQDAFSMHSGSGVRSGMAFDPVTGEPIGPDGGRRVRSGLAFDPVTGEPVRPDTGERVRPGLVFDPVTGELVPRGETPRADDRPPAHQGIAGDWYNSKGTIAVLRFTLNRGVYSGILLYVSAQSHAKGFRKGDVAYSVKRVSRWVYEGQVLSRYTDGRKPHWKQQIRFIISSQNPNVMKGYGKYGTKTDAYTYTRSTR
ncbi:MAG: hypothetical protein QGG42_08755 [Phycisphaerae bacterium]|nr:hypothetical protein [Phycisphaerae bacterium]